MDRLRLIGLLYTRIASEKIKKILKREITELPKFNKEESNSCEVKSQIFRHKKFKPIDLQEISKECVERFCIRPHCGPYCTSQIDNVSKYFPKTVEHDSNRPKTMFDWIPDDLSLSEILNQNRSPKKDGFQYIIRKEVDVSRAKKNAEEKTKDSGRDSSGSGTSKTPTPPEILNQKKTPRKDGLQYIIRKEVDVSRAKENKEDKAKYAGRENRGSVTKQSPRPPAISDLRSHQRVTIKKEWSLMENQKCLDSLYKTKISWFDWFIRKFNIEYEVSQDGIYQRLGSGTFGQVYAGKLDLGKEDGETAKVAIKIFYSHHFTFKSFLEEAYFQDHIHSCRFVPKFYGIVGIRDISNNFAMYGMVSELITEPSLATYGNRFRDVLREDNIRLNSPGKPFNGTLMTKLEWVKVLYRLSKAICLVHNRELVLNDLKSDNVLLRKDVNMEWMPVLIDFGLMRSPSCLPYSVDLGKRIPEDFRKKHQHLAPEVYQNGHGSYAADIYSYGRLCRKVAGVFGITELDGYGEACMAEKPEHRPSIYQVMEFMGSYRLYCDSCG